MKNLTVFLVFFSFAADCGGLNQGRRVAEVAHYLEQKCLCGISALYLQGETLKLWVYRASRI